LYGFFKTSDSFLANRLESLKSGRYQALQKEHGDDFFNRVIKPILEKFASTAQQFNNNFSSKNIEKKLVWGGIDHLITAEQFLGIKVSVSVILPVLYIVHLFAAQSLGLGNAVWGTILVIVGYLLPDFWLKRRIKSRFDSIEAELPSVLDILAVSSNAGLGFLDSIKKMVQKTDGVLADEFGQVLYDLKMGEPRDKVLEEFAYRCNTDDVKRFTNAILQAEKFGTSISDVLNSQAKVMKNKLKSRTEERVNKAPVKLILPLVFFVLPSILIFLLGPAILQIAEVFV
jgi:tight adherence protein C